MEPLPIASFRYDPFSPEAMRDPHSFYPVLRDAHPAWFIEEYDTWVFSRFEDVWTGFMDAENFSEAEMQLFAREALLEHHRGCPPEPRIDPEKAMFLFLDPSVHTRFRQAIAAPFLKGNVAKLEDTVTRLVRERLAAHLPTGRFDLNLDLASSVSVPMTSMAMGLEIDDPAQITGLVARLVARAPGQPGATADGMAARAELVELLCGEVRRRRVGKGTPSPVIDPLIAKDLIGRPLSDEEIAVDCLAILAGGAETVPKVFAGGLLEMQKRPEQLEAVAGDPARNAPFAVEEMLRFNAPAQWFGRTVKRRCELGGVTLEAGQRVILLLASANRDPREFENADEFIWNRKARRMISFGVGPHFCIGIHLARLECQVLVREFLATARRFTIHPEDGEWAQSEFQIGWLKLPVTIHE